MEGGNEVKSLTKGIILAVISSAASIAGMIVEDRKIKETVNQVLAESKNEES